MIPWQGTGRDGVPLMRCERLLPAGWIDIQMSEQRKTQPHERTGLICCNFVFTRGAWVREVPEDPAMINAGHEAALSVRTFTHGCDIYLPDEIQIWHLDYDNYPEGQRHRVWEAKSDSWQAEGSRNMLRRLHALSKSKRAAAVTRTSRADSYNRAASPGLTSAATADPRTGDETIAST